MIFTKANLYIITFVFTHEQKYVKVIPFLLIKCYKNYLFY